MLQEDVWPHKIKAINVFIDNTKGSRWQQALVKHQQSSNCKTTSNNKKKIKYLFVPIEQILYE